MVLLEGSPCNLPTETRMQRIKSRIGSALGRAGDIITGRPSPESIRHAERILNGDISDLDRYRYRRDTVNSLYAGGSVRPDPLTPPDPLLMQSIDEVSPVLRNLPTDQVDQQLREQATKTLSRVRTKQTSHP